MAGNTGSPLCAELNRIANYGVYPDRDDFLEEQGAANVWAGTSGLGLLGALNYIVDPTRTDNNYKGLTAVCNELAGTTGLSDVDALRTIGHPAEVLLKGTTARSASYYVDAAVGTNYIPTTASGYMYLPGSAGNYASAPDSSALDITGDIDLRAKVALDNWVPGGLQGFISKWLNSGNQLSYILAINADGTLIISWTTNGNVATMGSASSTVIVGAANGTVKWVRVTLDVNNGASGKDVKFWTSDDGTTWTQLGATVTSAGTTSIHSGSATLNLGANGFSGPGAQEVLRGKLYRAQVLNGIDGTVAFDANFETAMTAQTVTSFTESSANAATVTVNRTTYNFQLDTLPNLGTAGSLLPTTVGSSLAADSNDAKFLDHTGTNYVYLPGVAANHLTTPDAAALDVTGDIDLRVKVALDDWTPGAINMLISKWQTNIEQSYLFYVLTDGRLEFNWSTTGILANTPLISSVATGIADGSVKWVRVTVDVDNGASGKTAKFYTSDDGTTWTQLGTDIVQAGTTSIFSSSSQVAVGAYLNGTSLPTAGKIFRAQILNGIDGTTVLDVDTSVITAGAATSFTAVTGQTITIARSTSGRKTVAVTQPTWLFGTDDYMEVNNRYMAHSTAAENYVYLSGASGNYMSVADNPPLDVTGDIDLRAYVALDDWTPSASNVLISKRNANFAYQFQINLVDGQIGIVYSLDGTTGISSLSTVGTGITDGVARWVRATRVASTGLCRFFTSTDGTTWTQLGADVSGTAGNIFSSADPVEIGSRTGGTALNAKGKIFRAQILNGIDGTIVLDADASVITLPSQTTFVDRSSNAYTVTINKSGVGTFVSTGNYLYLPGVNENFASAPDSAALDITGDIDVRVKVALDDWSPSTSQMLLTKWDTGSGLQGAYRFTVDTAARLNFSWSPNGGTTAITAISTAAPTVVDGGTLWIRATLDVDNGASGNDVKFFTSNDGLTWTQLGTTVTNAGVTSIFNSNQAIKIGVQNVANVTPSRGKFFRAQVLNGIGGTVAFDANFENSITSLLQTSFTESSTNGATVTINRSGSTYRSAGVIDAGYLYPGATNTFANSTIDYLNFGATDSFTVLFIMRNWPTYGYATNYTKGISTASFPSWYQYNVNSSTQAAEFKSGAVTLTRNGASRTDGATSVTGFVLDRTAQTVASITNGALSATSSTSTLGTLENSGTLKIAATGAGNFAELEFVSMSVFRSALTPKNIADIYNYFNGRD